MADINFNEDICKENLQQYLLDRVLERISGRDGRDVLGKPSRTLFAGVLSPRFTESDGTFQEKRQTSSIGLDFKLRPRSKEKINITIKPKWAFYYPVFPKLQIVRKYNSILNKEQEDPSTLIVPVAFRRKETDGSSFSFDVSEQTSSKIFDFQEDIAKIKSSIDKDPERWRHLGHPKNRKLDLKSKITTDSEYENLLKQISATSGIQMLPEWQVKLHLEVSHDIADPNIYRIRILLSNDTLVDNAVDDFSLDERSLFDSSLEVYLSGGEIVPFEFLLSEKDYRSKPLMVAKGINCVILSDGPKQTLKTETLPVYEQPLYRTRQEAGIKFETLSKEEPEGQLGSVVASMREYLTEWDKYLTTEKAHLSSIEIEQCKTDRDAFQAEINGYLLGIECLKRNALLNKSFTLMNRVFCRISERSGGKIQSWRLFQICFIVSQMPALMARELVGSDETEFKIAVMQSFEKASVLWFPTGGGKTEAYLGLIAVSLIFDRLRGKKRGVNTWMRFPLRMLSLQQMERLSRVIAELNVLRDREKTLQQGDPFSIGYYVGDAVTPNRLSDISYYEKEQNRKKLLLLRKCPYCDRPSEISIDKPHWRLVHRCTNDKCFSNTASSLGSQRGTLPLYIVDNEIYRYLPSVLVGTVDKLAIAGFNANFSHLLNGVTQSCPEHGFASYDSCLESYSAECHRTKKSDLTKLDPIRDPGLSLLIQDELHLLKSDLGVFNGHYEGFLQYIGRKVYLPPKILAATATIEAYSQQAFHLYLKESERFPVPSWQKGESFYATSSPLKKRRKYVGILCHTKSVVDAASRLLFLYQFEIKFLKEKPELVKRVINDPKVTDEQIAKILTLYDFSLAYVNKKSVGSNLLDRLDQKSEEFTSEGLPKIRHELLTGDRNPEDIGITLERIQMDSTPKLDVVAATSLISHGVDLERINMMTMCGMPSHYSEYIQSSSRSARSHPGFVFVCFLSKDPRELSQYEMFMPMHENMDSLIEPVAVNRFASFAPHKTIPGLLSALLVNYLSPQLYKNGISRPLNHIPTLKIALGLPATGSSGTRQCLNTNDLLMAIEEIIGTDRHWQQVSTKEISNIKLRIKEILEDQIALIGRSPETKLTEVLNPITSFRDVDPGIEFVSSDSTSLVNRL